MTGDAEGSLAHACAELAHTMAGPDADRVLPEVAAHAATVLGVGTTGVVTGDDGSSLAVASSADERVAALVAFEQEIAEGPTLAAFAHGTVTRADTLLDVGPTWPGWAAEARARGVGAWLAVPSTSEGTTVVLAAASTRPRHWSDEDVTAATVLADLASGWLAHSSELDQARRTAAQLQEALDHRLVIEQAKGVLAGELGCTVEQAFSLLRNHARRNQVTVRSVAHAVVHLGMRPSAGSAGGGPASTPPDDEPEDVVEL